MAFFSLADIQSWERFYRGNFINSLSGFKSASLIATVNKEGISNVAIFSNIVHIGADPALIGFVNRPKEAAPDTLNNIEATGAYTINLIPANLIEQAHQTSAKYAESEFNAVGLTEEFTAYSKAPFVFESPVKYSMELKEIIPIKFNNTFFVIGAVTAVFADEQILAADGFLDLEKANIITSLGIDGYYATERLARFSYAKPGKELTRID
ncbi:flavin reductase family protein [Lacibacter sp.]|jgi:flavin reductase (DIM6/NTAB) family NADH-FMN oxidoreductase RutF|uniref:flavin reductase family protein n=1 Tax=Lacibacter sp. TaxID=1915409 RepID=UPI002B4ABB4F|nr:flavin reductase [Lacibacter sp.]HLP39381.1 flavin reductase [Lacibacter sp.]